MIRFILLPIVLAALAGCATTSLPPVTSTDFVFADDEKRLWTRSEEEEQSIDQSGMLYQDRELDAYLNGIAKKLQPAEAYQRIPFRIHVLKNPYCNAFAYPNGHIYIHTGILARIDNEAQLATLLAHEMTHATHRHQVREFRGMLNKSAVFASTRSLIGGLPGIGDLTTVLGEIGTTASINGHSRDLETEADMVGIRLVVKAGYDAREAPRLFQHLKDEMNEEEEKEPFFFGSHPRLAERSDNYKDFLAELGGGVAGVTNADTFRKNVAEVIIVNALMDFRAGRFPRARRGAEDYVKIRPRDGRGYYLLGEIARQKAEDGDLSEAKKQFQKAVSVAPSYADAYRGLGLVYFKEGNKSQAKKAFKSYLAKAPQAPDRSYIEDYVAQCN
jgi:beta-barrel assembly-enhancing protease